MYDQDNALPDLYAVVMLLQTTTFNCLLHTLTTDNSQSYGHQLQMITGDSEDWEDEPDEVVERRRIGRAVIRKPHYVWSTSCSLLSRWIFKSPTMVSSATAVV